MPNKTTIPDCIAERIDFNKVHGQDDLDIAIQQAYRECSREYQDECECSKGRTKREPSAYNKFISSCFKERKSAGKDVSKASDIMRECAGEWKTRKK